MPAAFLRAAVTEFCAQSCHRFLFGQGLENTHMHARETSFARPSRTPLCGALTRAHTDGVIVLINAHNSVEMRAHHLSVIYNNYIVSLIYFSQILVAHRIRIISLYFGYLRSNVYTPSFHPDRE